MKEIEELDCERILTERYKITPNGVGVQSRIPKPFIKRMAEAAGLSFDKFSRENLLEITWVRPEGKSIRESFLIAKVVPGKDES